MLPRRTQKLSSVMQDRGYTRATLAEAVNMDRMRLGNLIRGITYPADEELEALTKLLGVSVTDIFDEGLLNRKSPAGRKRGNGGKPTLPKRILLIEERLDGIEARIAEESERASS